MQLVSGVGAKGISSVALSGGRGLGPEGAVRLAGLLGETHPPLLSTLNLRQTIFFQFSVSASLSCSVSNALMLSLASSSFAAPNLIPLNPSSLLSHR